MPWCDSCDIYLAPNSVSTDGACPTCSSAVDMADKKDDPGAKVPWHFWLTLVAVVGYLVYRLVQGVGFLMG